MIIGIFVYSSIKQKTLTKRTKKRNFIKLQSQSESLKVILFPQKIPQSVKITDFIARKTKIILLQMPTFYLHTNLYNNIEEIMDSLARTSSAAIFQQQKPPFVRRNQRSKKIDCLLLKSQLQNINPMLQKTTNSILKSLKSQDKAAETGFTSLFNELQMNKSIYEEDSKKQNRQISTQPNLFTSKALIQDYKLDNVTDTINRHYIYQLYQGVKYSLQKLQLSSFQAIPQCAFQLKQSEQSKEKFLFLDLDQTILHTQKIVKFSQPHKTSYKICIRPYTFTFLQGLTNYYEIYAFTASARNYAEAVVKKINKNTRYIKDILSREHCVQISKNMLVKDLRAVKNRQLKDIVIIDNRVQSFGFQLDNGIPILGFDGYTEDKELLKLIPFLQQISSCQDVRPQIRQKFKLQRMLTIQEDQIQKFFRTRKY